MKTVAVVLTLCLVITYGITAGCFEDEETPATNKAPIPATNLIPEVVTVGQDVVVDASSSTDVDGTIVGYTWNMGDGTISSGAVYTHTYGVPGTYTIKLTRK